MSASSPEETPSKPVAVVVDDEECILEVVQAMLEAVNFETVLASSGRDALKLCKDWESDRGPDLLVTDMVMPGMTGQEVAECLREQFPGLPVLIISGELELDFETGAFLRKPFTFQELTSRALELIAEPEEPAAGG